MTTPETKPPEPKVNLLAWVDDFCAYLESRYVLTPIP